MLLPIRIETDICGTEDLGIVSMEIGFWVTTSISIFLELKWVPRDRECFHIGTWMHHWVTYTVQKVPLEIVGMNMMYVHQLPMFVTVKMHQLCSECLVKMVEGWIKCFVARSPPFLPMSVNFSMNVDYSMNVVEFLLPYWCSPCSYDRIDASNYSEYLLLKQSDSILHVRLT